MEDKDVVMIPFVVHEGDMARQERTIKRLYPRLYNGVMNKL